MRKLKLSVLLPLVQVVVAALILRRAGLPGSYVPTSKLVCFGLNAPAQMFILLNPSLWGPASDWLPRSILGIDTGDLFFLVGVAVIWYLVGRVLDRRGTPEPRKKTGIGRYLIVHTFLLAVGVMLLFLGLQEFQNPRYGGIGIRPERALLTLAWAAILIFMSVGGFKGRFVRKRAPNATGRITTLDV